MTSFPGKEEFTKRYSVERLLTINSHDCKNIEFSSSKDSDKFNEAREEFLK